MTAAILGRLEKVNVREIWNCEPRDFTPWLAQPENLSVLADALKMELEIEAQEKNVGPFRADILCKDTFDSSWVLVENQLECTDHKHLGQLLTYASGLQAVTIVWIATKFTEEHRAALDWLNKITDEQFKFFGLEVELWRIGDSKAAPKFNVISMPNEWSRSVGRAAQRIESETLSDRRALQLEFWEGLGPIVAARGGLRPQRPSPTYWTNFAIGRAAFHLSATIRVDEGRIGVELYIGSDKAKSYFDHLAQERAEINVELGCQPEWMELPERKACRIIVYKCGLDLEDRAVWPECHEWIAETLARFDHIFRERVRNLDADSYSPEGHETE